MLQTDAWKTKFLIELYAKRHRLDDREDLSYRNFRRLFCHHFVQWMRSKNLYSMKRSFTLCLEDLMQLFIYKVEWANFNCSQLGNAVANSVASYSRKLLKLSACIHPTSSQSLIILHSTVDCSCSASKHYMKRAERASCISFKEPTDNCDTTIAWQM